MTESKSIYSAVAKAMKEVKRLGKGNENREQKYNFASVDDFFEMVGPICAENGLVTIIDEDCREFLEKQGKYGATQWVGISYKITTFHASGESLPSVRRHIEVIRTGPQAYGAAQSYILKQYYRGLLNIPTGDKDDVDSGEAQEVPVTKISADQFREMQDLIDTTGTDEAKLLSFLKVDALEQLTKQAASNAIVMLKKKQTQAGEAQ